jgi:hypothetical protein
MTEVFAIFFPRNFDGFRVFVIKIVQGNIPLWGGVQSNNFPFIIG